VSPLHFARDIALDLANHGLPEPIHAQVGDIIVPCAGTYVSVLNTILVDLGNNCDAIEMAEVAVIAARDCANTANDDGTTNWAAQDAVSAAMDHDADVLWEWAMVARGEAVLRTGTPAITFSIQGAIAMTMMTVTLPIP
jgi:hypothetical protein